MLKGEALHKTPLHQQRLPHFIPILLASTAPIEHLKQIEPRLGVGYNVIGAIRSSETGEKPGAGRQRTGSLVL
jgi:hypothetical protein